MQRAIDTINLARAAVALLRDVVALARELAVVGLVGGLAWLGASMADTIVARVNRVPAATPGTLRAVAQVPRFKFDDEWVSIGPPPAERLVAALRSRAEWDDTAGSDYLTAAAKIEYAMELYHSTTVELEIGEDEAVLIALGDLMVPYRLSLPRDLDRLYRKLSWKIELEPAVPPR